MTKLVTVLNKLNKLNITVKKETVDVTDFYYFSINGKNYEFSNQPITGGVNAECLCRTFDNGSSPSFYSSLNQLLKMA